MGLDSIADLAYKLLGLQSFLHSAPIDRSPYIVIVHEIYHISRAHIYQNTANPKTGTYAITNDSSTCLTPTISY